MVRRRAFAPDEGFRIALGLALVLDAARCLGSPDSSLLAMLLRLPHGSPLPQFLAAVLGAALLVRGHLAATVLAAAALLAAWNTVEFYGLLSGGLHALPFPLSLMLALLFLFYAIRAVRPARGASRIWALSGAAVGAPAFLLLHLLTFGATDYARRADAIVVFGAKVYEDGSPSLALEDRVRHALRLYHQGVAPRIVMSGGADEVRCMVRLALEDGVPAPAIEEDPDGLNTWATMSNLRHRRVVAVSHYYHLARIKLCAGRLGISCRTVPCRMSRGLTKEPYLVAREVAAFAAYYLLR